MPDDGPTDPCAEVVMTTAGDRRRAVVVAGHRGDERAVRGHLADADPLVRAAALGALVRMERVDEDEIIRAMGDASSVVRRRAVRAAAEVHPPSGGDLLTAALVGALGDPDPLVVEEACWSIGERGVRQAVPALGEVAAGHADTRCREGAVAALGAIGEPAGLPAVLSALDDKPTVRRRAAVALAAFDGPEAEEALRRCLTDRDWQVRQVAERLLSP